jgi:hypothetical protein
VNIKESNIKLLGHLLRREPDDPVKAVSLKVSLGTAQRVEAWELSDGKKHVGGQRHQWSEKIIGLAQELLGKLPRELRKRRNIV